MVDHAFATLNLRRVWLRVAEDNERAQRRYRPVGFQKEGALREDYYREGRHWNLIVMGLLWREWEANCEPPI